MNHEKAAAVKVGLKIELWAQLHHKKQSIDADDPSQLTGYIEFKINWQPTIEK